MNSTTAVSQPSLRAERRPDECEILLIRHGRSADVVPGSVESADPPLHELGIDQARRVAHRLAAKHLDAVYSSHLARARQTAEAIASGRSVTVEIRPDLEEIRLGDWSDGEFRRRAATNEPEWVAWSRTGRWDGIPGCEGDDAFRSRLSAVLDAVVERHRGQTVAVVCHGGSINALLSGWLGIHRSLWMTVENTSISTVRLGPDGPTVVGVNDCHHLYDPVLGSGQAVPSG